MSRGISIDWAEIRRRNAERLVLEAARRGDLPPAPPPARPSASKSQRAARAPGSYSKVELVRRYKAGEPVAEIAQALGIDRSTAYRALKRAGAYEGTAKGAPRKTHCKRNHDLAVYGKPHSNGGRFCSECKRMSQRVGARTISLT